MSDQRSGGISWTDETWNPVRGCSRVSEGCRNCYAERQAARFSAPGQPYEGLVRLTSDGPKWTGRVKMVENHLLDPLRWKRPRRVFVNSMSDLFHDNLPDEEIDRIFAVMALAQHHTFQVLTKRPKRMRDWVGAATASGCLERLIDGWRPSSPNRQWLAANVDDDDLDNAAAQWPLPNVWLGVSVENQETADERIPLLLQTPAAVRFVSAEPLLGAVRFKREWVGQGSACPECGFMVAVDEDGCCAGCGRDVMFFGIDWLVVGGESGHGARPMHPDWARSLRDQCKAAGVPFFFKQYGEWAPGTHVEDNRHYATKQLNDDGRWFDCSDDWVAEADGGEIMYRIGKRAAGDLLDGVQHHEFPEVRPT